MYPVDRIIPLIFPKEQYTDRFGEPNALVDMNPSMHIDKDGQITLLVRRVNYRKYADKRFSLGSYPSESKYIIARGEVRNLTRWDVTPLRVDYGVSTYPSYWKGPEDIRFTTDNRIIVTIPECNPTGNPAIFRACLDGSVLNYVEPCYPNAMEKNWMPYTDENYRLKVVYSVCPFSIKDVGTDTIETIGNNMRELKGYHGSTNGILFHGEYRLFLVHINRERTYHRWLLFHPLKKTVQISEEFTFFQHSYIEFPLSLCEYNGILYVSIGVNDENSYILVMNPPMFSGH